MERNMIGIYKITNLITLMFYIGSAININQRWSRHKTKLRGNKHENSHLQNAWSKYGESNFSFEVIETILIKDKKYILEREQYWLDESKCYEKDKGYNICKVAGNTLGRKFSEEAFKKLIVSHTSEDYRKKMSLLKLGHEVSEEAREKIGKSSKGRKHSIETKQKMSMLHKRRLEDLKEREKCASPGETNPASKLTWEQVREIRAKYIPHKYTMMVLAKEYGVSYITIKRIIKNKSWINDKENKNV